MYFEKLWREFAALPGITAAALGGSRAADCYDEKFDYDLYLYCTAVPEEAARRELLSKYCGYMEIGNVFWEPEDDCTLKDGVDIDILYRDPADFEKGLADVVEAYHAGNGYTTCMWHNLLSCRILYDEHGVLKKMKERFTVPYPEKLRQNIIDRNLKLLSGYLPSYKCQILKAQRRRDLVSVNHRTAAFLESYFDVVFALNRLTHPGEKRMTQYALEHAVTLPADFEKDLSRLFDVLFDEGETLGLILTEMTEKLKEAVEKAGQGTQPGL